MTKVTVSGRTSAILVATTLALVLLAVGAGPAGATFPGANGKIVFSDRTRMGEARTSTVKPDGSRLAELTDLAGSQAFASGPDWSPDGTRIAFATERDGNGEIYTVTPNGTGLTNLSNYPAEDDVYPSWSPDGTRIAFSGLDPDSFVGGIYTMDADGSEQRRLTKPTTGSDYRPAWSPDGTRIAFDSSRYYDDRLDDDASLYIMNSDGTGQTILMNGPELEQNPSWQPIPRCTVTGTPGNDRLRGTVGEDVICGLAGNDTLSGWDGDDILIGGKGDDAIYGGTDNDTLNGGPGTDTASYLGAATAVEASLTTDFATGQGSDVFVGVEDLTGTASGDTLEGSNKANVLEGLGGNDVLKVRDGRDNDTADGGTGSDACLRDPGDTARSCS